MTPVYVIPTNVVSSAVDHAQGSAPHVLRGGTEAREHVADPPPPAEQASRRRERLGP